MPTRVYLGDLRYNTGGVLANDCMPLGVAYMKAVMDRDNEDVESRLFVYPDRLLEAITAAPPDVLMLSNYVWNEALSREFFRIVKQVHPKVLTVMGGPNLPIEPDRQIAYVEAHPEIDVYITGEADFRRRAPGQPVPGCRPVAQILRHQGYGQRHLAQPRGPGGAQRDQTAPPRGRTRSPPPGSPASRTSSSTAASRR